MVLKRFRVRPQFEAQTTRTRYVRSCSLCVLRLVCGTRSEHPDRNMCTACRCEGQRCNSRKYFRSGCSSVPLPRKRRISHSCQTPSSSETWALHDPSPPSAPANLPVAFVFASLICGNLIAASRDRSPYTHAADTSGRSSLSLQDYSRDWRK